MNTEVPENASITQGADAPKPTSILNFEFRGDGMEYFKIWIVNILLTIVTLGIYSAWAKVLRLPISFPFYLASFIRLL